MKEYKLSDFLKKEITLLELMDSLDLEGTKRGNRMFYESPFHDEHTPSFTVHIKKNYFKNFGGDEEWGNLIDFGVRYWGSIDKTYKELRTRFPHQFDRAVEALKEYQKTNIAPPSLQQQNQLAAERIKNSNPELKRTVGPDDEMQLIVLAVKKDLAWPLQRYLEDERKIPVSIAKKYCVQVEYTNKEVPNSRFYAVGLKNESDGFALRNKYVKQATIPGDVTFINNGSKNVVVVEGMMELLSYQVLYHKKEEAEPNFLVLNSTSNIERGLPYLQRHDKVFNYLNNDTGGENCTVKIKAAIGDKMQDMRSIFSAYIDMNDKLTGRLKADVMKEKQAAKAKRQAQKTSKKKHRPRF